MSLRVLITNIELFSRSGTSLYIRDLALELQRQGCTPAVYMLDWGEIAAELAEASIPVTDNLRRLDFQPEIIHGHHFAPTMSAVQYFAAVPAIFICHSHTSGHDRAPFHPRIQRYFGVSRICVERLISEGVPAGNARLSLNFVDLKRFLPRPPLPEQPRRALVFSNYARAETHLPAVAEACRQAGLELDVVGAGVDNLVARPEDILGKYDIVFAKAKAAMEAMAVGTAVILCDFSGVGPIVTSAKFEELRPLNFGFQAMQAPLRPDNILSQIAQYDPHNAACVRDLLRASAGLDQATKNLVDIYQDVIEEHQRRSPDLAEERIWQRLLWQRLSLKLTKAWVRLPPSKKVFVRKLPGSVIVREKIKKLLLK